MNICIDCTHCEQDGNFPEGTKRFMCDNAGARKEFADPVDGTVWCGRANAKGACSFWKSKNSDE